MAPAGRSGLARRIAGFGRRLTDAAVRWMTCVLGRSDTGPLGIYCLKASIVAMVPSALVSTFVVMTHLALDPQATWRRAPVPEVSLATLLDMVIIAPLVESALMACLIEGLRLLVHDRTRIALVCTVVMAGLHGLFSVGWGLSVAWTFFVLANAYLIWRRRGRAFAAASVPHALINLSMFLVIAAP